MRVKGTNVCEHSNCNITMKVGYKYQNDVKIHNTRAYDQLLSNQTLLSYYILVNVKHYMKKLCYKCIVKDIIATHIQFSYFYPLHLHSSILVLQLAKDISVL